MPCKNYQVPRLSNMNLGSLEIHLDFKFFRCFDYKRFARYDTQQKKTSLLGSSSLSHVKSRLSIYTRVQVSA